MLKDNNKKLFAFSWEARQTKQKLYYPLVSREQRLPDGHLNAVGTKNLFNFIQARLGDA